MMNKNITNGGIFMKKIIVSTVLFIFVLAFGINTGTNSKAAQLYTNSKKIQNGKKAKIELYFYYGKSKAKWSVSNNKIKIVKRTNKSCTIKGVKVGSAYVKCRIGRKTYKIKITVKQTSKVTYSNFNEIENGMTLEDAKDILGNYTEVDYARIHTAQEYQDYCRWQYEDGGGWEDELWRKQVRYKWENPWTRNCIYLTFNDGYLCDKLYM